jgi:hypothetical protein
MTVVILERKKEGSMPMEPLPERLPLIFTRSVVPILGPSWSSEDPVRIPDIIRLLTGKFRGYLASDRSRVLEILLGLTENDGDALIVVPPQEVAMYRDLFNQRPALQGRRIVFVCPALDLTSQRFDAWFNDAGEIRGVIPVLAPGLYIAADEQLFDAHTKRWDAGLQRFVD